MGNNKEFRVKDLANAIVRYAHYYYEGTPLVSDDKFDLLVDELRELDPENEVLNKTGWGYSPVVTDTREVRKHRHEVAKFSRKIKDSKDIDIPKSDRMTSYKLDGISINLYYTNGMLEYGLTRGDGVTGEDVTNKLSRIVPIELNDRTFTGLVRGEGMVSMDDFDAYYASEYASPRNLAVGMFKRLTITEVELSRLHFVGYTVQGITEEDISSKIKVYDWLSRNNFEVVDQVEVLDWSDSNLDRIVKSYDKYLIDGLVVTNNNYIKSEGVWSPKQEIAYKIPADKRIVTVKDIKWNMTRLGRFVPVIEFDPINLSGATIRRATAHNAEFVKINQLDKGALIEIQRSGEIIPYISRVLQGAPEYGLPTTCSICEGDLEWVGVNLVCNNSNCSHTGSALLNRWFNVFGAVKGAGPAMIQNLFDTFEITSIPDLYDGRLTEESLREVYGSSSATFRLACQVIERLNEPKYFEHFLLAMNLGGVGQSAVKRLAKYKEEILSDGPVKLDGIGVGTRKAVLDGLDRIRENAKYVTFIDKEVEDRERDPNKVIAVTGALSVSRQEFADMIKESGWSIGPINKAKYLVTNTPESGSSKNRQARERGVDILNESDFLNLL